MRQNNIKVFHAGSKRADFSVIHSSPDAIARKVASMLGDAAATKVLGAFNTLQSVGGDSLSFRTDNRKIKVSLAA